MDYEMNGYRSCEGLENARVVKDPLAHLNGILDQCQFKKTERRSGINQLAYKMAKTFGHRSSYHDIYLHHKSIRPVVGQDPMIPIPEITTLSVHYRLLILGRATKRALKSGNLLDAGTDTPNEIFLNFTMNYRELAVVMELTASAFINLCCDYGKHRLAKRVNDMIRAKWGGGGEDFGVYEPWGNRHGDEGYRLVRTVNGRPVTQTVGASWIGGYDNRKAQGW